MMLRWNDEEVVKLVSLREKGCSYKEIAKQLNKTKSAVQKKYYRLTDSNYVEKEKQYREDNREKISEQKKQYYEDNREKLLEQQKQYREDNKDKISEQKKQYYEDNREKLLEQQKQYYQDNKDKISEYKKQYYKDNRDKILENQKQYDEDKINKLIQEYSDFNNIPAEDLEYLNHIPHGDRILETEFEYTNFGTAPTGFERHHIIPYKTCIHYRDLHERYSDDWYYWNNKACDFKNNGIDLPIEVHRILHSKLTENGYNSKDIIYLEKIDEYEVLVFTLIDEINKELYNQKKLDSY